MITASWLLGISGEGTESILLGIPFLKKYYAILNPINSTIGLAVTKSYLEHAG